MTRSFQAGPAALVRAVARPDLGLPPLPDLTDTTPDGLRAQRNWLAAVHRDESVRELLDLASPQLLTQITTLLADPDPRARPLRKALVSAMRYLIRAEGRATPFGLFAGVATAEFTGKTHVRWGGAHRAVVRAGSGWLAPVLDALEGDEQILARLSVVANSSAFRRGSRLVVPYAVHRRADGVGAAEVSLRWSPQLALVWEAAAVPVRFEQVEKEVADAYGTVSPDQVRSLLVQLVRNGALITSLRAPSTVPDALGHVLTELSGTPAGRELGQIATELTRCGSGLIAQTRAARTAVAQRMRAMAPEVKGHPLAVDLRLDLEVRLPEAVRGEVERAAAVLAALSPAPFGLRAWKDYHQRFYERYGVGALVPVPDVVADSGLGFPDGYPGTGQPSHVGVRERDARLLRLAQQAVLDRVPEVVLDDAAVGALAVDPEQVRLPPHLEVGVRVHASSASALDAGAFRTEVVAVSRGAGVRTGRFLAVLPPGRADALRASLSLSDGVEEDTIVAQLSFPPLLPSSAHVTRAPQALPFLISLSEHRTGGHQVLTLADLAVGCDGRRLFLAAPGLGVRVEAVGMHALSLTGHTPPLARFLIELGRAHCAAVTRFDWGLAASMPFLPRLRYGRTILSPARWRLDPSDHITDEADLAAWAERREVPEGVYLSEGDQQLPLDLDHPTHRLLLKSHLERHSQAQLCERIGEFGWLEGRDHEITVPLHRTTPPAWPRLPRPTRARVLSRDAGQPAAAPRTVLADLYGDVQRQDTILTEELPRLLDRLGFSRWWFVRYRDPDPLLRLRINLDSTEQLGPVTARVTEWVEQARRAGLLREVRFRQSFPETGRWGSGDAWRAAESVFRADSRAVLGQLRQQGPAGRHVLYAANAASIAAAFCGNPTAGARWLVEHLPADAPVSAVPRPVWKDAVRLADPTDHWAALRAVPEGARLVESWRDRTRALAAYRAAFPGPGTEGVDVDAVLTTLLHVHHIRAHAIDFDDEQVASHLARTAALAYLNRTDRRSA